MTREQNAILAATGTITRLETEGWRTLILNREIARKATKSGTAGMPEFDFPAFRISRLFAPFRG